ncbi:MAG: sensor histidine kinase [Clostridiales bacterium]|nr:MAG: sensor histidine kinase [Clostridiales bacterium]
MRAPIRQTLFPNALLGVIAFNLLLMSGVHFGLIVLGFKYNWPLALQILFPIFYWDTVAIGLTLLIKRYIKRAYEIPLLRLAESTKKVAEGDFSVYVAPTHTGNKTDFLDEMIMDFNKMVQELGSIETLKTDFLSNVSHEFKTPLAVIHNNAQLLVAEEITDERRRECAENILFADRKLSQLISNMLKLNKLEKQVISPKAESYDLCEQIAQCIFQFEDALEQKNIDLQIDMEDRAFAMADSGLVELVWMNLLSNAVKFTPAGGIIKIEEYSSAEEIVVTVSDNGCGMSAEDKAKVFEKFYQADTSHATEGNGLGLALVKRILELSGGMIAVQSALGKGTSFEVRLPKAV